jgi:hypothetical protein
LRDALVFGSAGVVVLLSIWMHFGPRLHKQLKEEGRRDGEIHFMMCMVYGIGTFLGLGSIVAAVHLALQAL